MTGRGVDQLFRVSCEPALREPYVRDARDYLAFAREASGPLPTPVDPAYVWGDALKELARAAPALRIVNLETAVTTSDQPWPGKGIHYRMHPANVSCLEAAGVHCCVLANNHVLDWGREGLAETLTTLREAGIATAGAGEDREEALAPAVLDTGLGRRVLVYGLGSVTSGVPRDWSARPDRSGVALLEELDPDPVMALARRVEGHRRAGDVVVASIHWGGNWGYEVPAWQRELAHRLVDEAAVDLVHGHSSHHPRGMEVHHGRLILYGAGDFLNDYEGISGHEEFRGDLTLLYLPTLDPAGGRLLELELVPFRIRRMRLEKAAPDDGAWLRDVLDRESEHFGARVESTDDGLALRW